MIRFYWSRISTHPIFTLSWDKEQTAYAEELEAFYILTSTSFLLYSNHLPGPIKN